MPGYATSEWPTSVARLRAASDGSLDILALSGGGAGGAYGAGALVGLSKTHDRARYEAVTGVSTGALMAPFAFLGPDWDDTLRDAFTGSRAQRVLRRRGIGALFHPGVFAGEPLRDLVDHFVTPELMAAVARETAQGRVLLIGTTNLDTQQFVIWNMGDIAARGDEQARVMFRDVLVASASVPGVFPPVMLRVVSDGQARQEMHVDGSVAAPFFVLPQLVSQENETSPVAGRATVHVIINGWVESHVRATPLNTVPIVSRSFETSQMLQARMLLTLLDQRAEEDGLLLAAASIPRGFPFRGPLNFRGEDLQSLFAEGERMAISGMLWNVRGPRTHTGRDLGAVERKRKGSIPVMKRGGSRDMVVGRGGRAAGDGGDQGPPPEGAKGARTGSFRQGRGWRASPRRR